MVGSSWEYWTPTYSNFESLAAASLKPFTRASTVETPGSVEMTSTFPPSGFCSWIASKAAAPPPSLSEATWDTANDGSWVVVSTSTTLMPAAAASARGRCIAATSVGATRMASGCEATTESTIGFCRVGSNFGGPWVFTVTPSFSASSSMPHCMVM